MPFAENNDVLEHLSTTTTDPALSGSVLPRAWKGKALGRKLLSEVAGILTPDTLLAWHRKLIGRKCDYSAWRNQFGQPRVMVELTELVLRLAKENPRRGARRTPQSFRRSKLLGFTRLFGQHGSFAEARGDSVRFLAEISAPVCLRPRLNT